MSKAILIVDIDDGIDLTEVEIEYYVYEIPKIFCFHDIPFGKKIIKAGVIYDPRPLPQKKEELDINSTLKSIPIKGPIIMLDKVIEKARQQGYNSCLDEILGGIIW